jgi:hypothetical protein
MDFQNNNLRLIIKGDPADEPLSFKAYLEKSDVQVKFVDETLKYTPLGYTNNTLLTKIVYNIDFSFNVFSEDFDEAVQNYVYLHKLINMIKPKYTIKNNQYIPDPKNIFGLLQIYFKGLPVLSKFDYLPVYVTNFNYQINKDMGFIEGNFPYDLKGDERLDYEQLDREAKTAASIRKVNFEGIALFKNYRLLPLAYKLDIAGRVQLSLNESIWNKSNVKENSALEIISEKIGDDINASKDYRNILIKLSGDQDILEKLSAEELSNAIEKIKFFKEKGFLDDNGNITYERFDSYDQAKLLYDSRGISKQYEGDEKACLDAAVQKNLKADNLKYAASYEECFTKLLNYSSEYKG